jgi:hypothetical protein
MNGHPTQQHPALAGSAVPTGRLRAPLRALATAATLALALVAAPCGAAPDFVAQWNPTSPGLAYGFLAGLTRVAGSARPYNDFTVAVQATARNDRNVHQWAFGVASEAWALPGSRSTLVGVEAAVINEELTNQQSKVATNLVFKNRADGGMQPDSPMNHNSIALWVTAQPGTGFERGIVFGAGSLMDTKQRPAVLDLSDLSDEDIARVDLIRLRKDVVLRYDPAARALRVVVETPGG